MSPEQFLQEAITAAPQGSAELRARIPAAERSLQEARLVEAQLKDEVLALGQKRVALSALLEKFHSEFTAVITAGAQTLLRSLEPNSKAASAILDQALLKRRAIRDKIALANETALYLTGEELKLAVRQCEAEIAVEEQTRSWIIASGTADVAELYLTMVTVSQTDGNINFEMGPGSKPSVYTSAVNACDAKLANLRERLENNLYVAQRHFAEQERKIA